MRRPTDMGDGNWCPIVPDHGRMIRTQDGRQWCPHHQHDENGTPSFFETDGKTPAKRKGPS